LHAVVEYEYSIMGRIDESLQKGRLPPEGLFCTFPVGHIDDHPDDRQFPLVRRLATVGFHITDFSVLPHYSELLAMRLVPASYPFGDPLPRGKILGEYCPPYTRTAHLLR